MESLGLGIECSEPQESPASSVLQALRGGGGVPAQPTFLGWLLLRGEVLCCGVWCFSVQNKLWALCCTHY